MCFDDRTSDSTITRRHFVFALGRDEAFIYDVFAPKVGRGYFSRKEIVRLYRRSRLILASVYLSRSLFSLILLEQTLM